MERVEVGLPVGKTVKAMTVMWEVVGMTPFLGREEGMPVRTVVEAAKTAS